MSKKLGLAAGLGVLTLSVAFLFYTIFSNSEDILVVGLTSSSSPPEEVEQFSLGQSPELVEFVHTSSDSIPSGFGIYFLDIDSGLVEGLRPRESSIGPGPVLSISSDNRLVGMNAHRVLIDRATESVYSWHSDAELVHRGHTLIAAGERVIFRLLDWLIVGDITADPKVVAQVEVRETDVALLTADGQQLVIMNSDSDVLLALDLANGTTMENVNSGLFQFPGSRPATPLESSQPLIDFGDLAHTTGPFSVDVVDAESKEPIFRVVGASTCYIRNAGSRWLSDGSGLVVRVADPGTSSSGREVDFSSTYAVAALDGELQVLPFPSQSEPIPSPTESSIFAIRTNSGGIAVVNVDGQTLAISEPDGGIESGVPPWGADGSEVRFVTPQFGGGDARCNLNSSLRPFVEMPPFSDPPVLLFHPEMLGTPLMHSPGDSEPVGEVLTSLEVNVLEVSLLFQSSISEVWARVSTPEGEQGWVRLGDAFLGP